MKAKRTVTETKPISKSVKRIKPASAVYAKRKGAFLGMVRAAVIRAMTKRKWSKYQLWKATEVPRTIVYTFLGEEDGRDINLRHVEAMMIALGITLMIGDEVMIPASQTKAS